MFCSWGWDWSCKRKHISYADIILQHVLFDVVVTTHSDHSYCFHMLVSFSKKVLGVSVKTMVIGIAGFLIRKTIRWSSHG